MFIKHNQFFIALFVVIFLLCLLPGKEVPESGMLHLDKFVHVVLFGLLSFCGMVGFAKQHQFKFLSKNVVLIATVFSISYGLLIELFQKYFLADRAFELLDLAADTLGVLLAYMFFFAVRRTNYKR